MSAEKLYPAVQINLKVLKGPHEGQTFQLTKSSFTVGRGPENEVVLINDPQISRQHARLTVVGQDIEITNLSKKNKVLVGTEEIQKWKLINDSTFVLGETEIKVVFDIEKITPIAPMASTPQGPQLVRLKLPSASGTEKPPSPVQIPLVKQVSKKRPMPLANRQQVPAQRQQQVQVRDPMQPTKPMMQPMSGLPPLSSNVSNSGGGLSGKAKFYIILGVAVLGLVYWLTKEEPKPTLPTEVKSTLKYEDEYILKQSSIAEKELDQKRKSQLAEKNSPTNLRIQENFQKGMRDYQLGNYARALDFFQVVLNLDSSHVMARRHLYLSKIRFDEIVKAKLALGESYYQKHNFKMCQAMYQQVLIMLQGKNSDQSYQIAQSMSDKCGLAAEGIR